MIGQKEKKLENEIENKVEVGKGKRESSIQLLKIWKIYKLRIIALAVVVAVLFFAFFIFPALKRFFVQNDGVLTTISESSISEILDVSELSTLVYIYNSTVEVRDLENYEIKYHVAYEGEVTMGVNFSMIQVEKKAGDEKKLVVTLPEVEVQNVYVDAGKMEYIFTKEKYDTEAVAQEAYKKCVKDLENKAKSKDTLRTWAREGAEQTIRALLQPFAEQADGYEIEFLEEASE